jgi:hypothetical protein
LAHDRCKKNDILNGGWTAVVEVVGASTSESPDPAHAADGFALVEFLIKLALEEVIVELASLILGPEGR